MSAFKQSHELQEVQRSVESASTRSSDLKTIGDEDALELARVGKKQVLKVRIDSISPCFIFLTR